MTVTPGAILYLGLFALVAILGVVVVIFWKWPTMTPGGRPTAEEAKIEQASDAERKKIAGQTPSGAQVRRLSDEELERELNDRSTD